MAYSYIGFAQSAAIRSVGVARPSGTQAGDLLIAHLKAGGVVYTAPEGWTQVFAAANNGDGAVGGHAVFSKVATTAEASSYAFSCVDRNGEISATVSTHRGTAGSVEAYRTSSTIVSGSGTSTLRAPNLPVTAYPGAPALFLFSIFYFNPQTLTRATYTQAYSSQAVGSEQGYQMAATYVVGATGSTDGVTGGAMTLTKSSTGNSAASMTSLRLAMPVSPYAPVTTTPSAGATIDRGVSNRFSWVHFDANGDPQATYSMRYRMTGATEWTTVADSTSNQYRDVAAGTFAIADYEWQVATADAGGLMSDWSASGFFTSRDDPTPPVITAPTSGSVAGPTPVTLSWTTPEQDAYQWRRVADASGSPAGGTVYEDSGTVVSDGTRATEVLFPTNLRTEWIQLRVRKAGLWSTWASTRQVVNYTPPAVPTVALAMDPFTASLLVTITDPTPTGNQPPVAYHDVYVNDGDGEERRATSVAGTWRHWTPRSGRNYLPNVRVVAVGQTGATSTSVPGS